MLHSKQPWVLVACHSLTTTLLAYRHSWPGDHSSSAIAHFWRPDIVLGLLLPLFAPHYFWLVMRDAYVVGWNRYPLPNDLIN